MVKVKSEEQTTEPITSFKGRWAFLSNFYRINVEYDGVRYPTVEHAYQAAKTEDMKWRQRIADSPTPGRAKACGRTMPLRSDWDKIKLGVMEELLRHKFSPRQYPVMAHLLEGTGKRKLIEGNDWGDRFWGAEFQCGESEFEPGEWLGKNHLGRLLMKIRGEL